MYTLARQQLGRPRLKRHRGQDSLDERFERVEQMLERSGGQSAASASDAHIDMLRLVSSLPNRQRDAIVLTVVSDLTDADAAQIMGISATSVKTHRRRGVESLRKASLTSMGLNSDQS